MLLKYPPAAIWCRFLLFLLSFAFTSLVSLPEHGLRAQPPTANVTQRPPLIKNKADFDAARKARIRPESTVGNTPPIDITTQIPHGVLTATKSLVSKQMGKQVSAEMAVRQLFSPSGEMNEEAAVIMNALLRPCLMVCNDKLDEPPGPYWESDAVSRKTQLESTLKSTGAISFSAGGKALQIGTGFVIAPGIIATNSHVARFFVTERPESKAYTLSPRLDGKGTMQVTIDFCRFDSHCTDQDRAFQITGVLYYSPNQSPDLALLRVETTNSVGKQLPAPLPLLAEADKQLYKDRLPGIRVFVSGYPSKSNYFATDTEKQIYKDTFDVKRLAFGQLNQGSSLAADLVHDCQTLGGSSGSPLCELESGKVIGVHKQGDFKVANYAVPIWAILDNQEIGRILAKSPPLMPTDRPGAKPDANATKQTPILPNDSKKSGKEEVRSAAPRSKRAASESSPEPLPARTNASSRDDFSLAAPPRPAKRTTESAVPEASSTSASIPLIAFDENGATIDSAGLDTLLSQADSDLSDIYLMCHGWNNSSAEAASSYEKMIGFVKAVAGSTRPAGYKELVLGIRWPSKAWISDDDSREEAAGPGTTALETGKGGPAGRSIDPRIVAALYENLPRRRATESQYSRDILRLQELIVKADATRDDFREALAIFQRYAGASEFPEEESIFNSQRRMEAALSLPVTRGELEGGFSILDIARVGTYYQMKSRAGLVGRNGVRSMIARLQTKFPAARIHLFGHSFGAKVLLAAVGEQDLAPPKPVTTLVLIQGAVSLEALAERVTDTDRPGGYRSAILPSRVSGKIIVTFSSRDRALNRYYPLASRLRNQTGELEAAGASKYSALGAFGAYGADSDGILMQTAGTAYAFSAKVTSVDGGISEAFIAGHSEIYNRNVAWLLWSAVKTSFK